MILVLKSNYCIILHRIKFQVWLLSSNPAANGQAGNGIAKTLETNNNQPPVPGAKLGKDPEGNPGWFIPDPQRPGKFMQVK